jgi:hypothetical protein
MEQERKLSWEHEDEVIRHAAEAFSDFDVVVQFQEPSAHSVDANETPLASRALQKNALELPVEAILGVRPERGSAAQARRQ